MILSLFVGLNCDFESIMFSKFHLMFICMIMCGFDYFEC